MIKKLFFYILISFSIFAIDEDLLSIKNHKYYYNGKLYNGEIEIYYIDKDNYKKTNKIYMKAKVVQGILNGQCKVYFDNGKLYKDENYKNDLLDGLNFYYHPNGNLMAVKNYSRGKLLGVYQDVKGTIPLTDYLIEYSSSGEIIRKVKYQKNLSEYDIEILNYVFTTEYERKTFNVNYPPNSTKIGTLSKGKYNLLEKRIGKWVVIDKISDSKLIVEYKEGEIDGSYQLYNKKGILILDENYKLGKRQGISKSYYDSGKLFTISQYDKGTPTGEWFEYHKNGKIRLHSLFKNGKPYGTWKHYNENGKIETEEFYDEDGRCIGFRDYNFFGKPKKTVNFEEVYKNAKPKVWH